MAKFFSLIKRYLFRLLTKVAGYIWHRKTRTTRTQYFKFSTKVNKFLMFDGLLNPFSSHTSISWKFFCCINLIVQMNERYIHCKYGNRFTPICEHLRASKCCTFTFDLSFLLVAFLPLFVDLNSGHVKLYLGKHNKEKRKTWAGKNLVIA